MNALAVNLFYRVEVYHSLRSSCRISPKFFVNSSLWSYLHMTPELSPSEAPKWDRSYLRCIEPFRQPLHDAPVIWPPIGPAAVRKRRIIFTSFRREVFRSALQSGKREPMNRLAQSRVPANLVSRLRCWLGSGERMPAAQWARVVAHLHGVDLPGTPLDVDCADPCGMRLTVPEDTVLPGKEES